MVDYQHYQIRIKRRWCDISGVIKGLSSKSDKCFAFEHYAEQASKAHVHCYVFNIKLKYDAISDRVKKLGLKGNQDFSVAGACGKDRRPLDVSGAWTYGTKPEALRPVWVENISPAVIEELSEGARRFYAKRDNTTPAVSVKAEKVKQKSKYAHVKEIAANCLSPEFLRLDCDQRVAVVLKETWSYLRQNQIFSDKWGIVKWCEAVLLELDDAVLFDAVKFQLGKNLGLII